MGLDFKWVELPVVKRRFLFYSAAAALIFFSLIARLWFLQVINYEHLLERSIRNRTRVLSLEAPRGPVYDRNGELLVDNRPSFQISVMRQAVEDRSLLFERLSRLLDISQELLEERWQEGQSFPVYRPIALATDVSWEKMVQIQEHGVDLPGVLTEVRPIRDYLDQGSTAHLVGYLGEITETELESEKFSNYRAGICRQTALERSYESYLRGNKGTRLVEVDVKGKLLRQLQMDAPTPGSKVYLTIDSELQAAAGEALQDQSGAAVVMDVNNGEVLAMASRPTFNPALFAKGIGGKEWRELAQNRRFPLQNKPLPDSTLPVQLSR